MDDLQWFYARNGVQQGPVTTEALRDLLTQRDVAPSDLVWRAGMVNWRPMHTQSEFSTQATPTAAAPAPVLPIAYRTTEAPNPMPAFILALVGLITPCMGFVMGIVAIILAGNSLSAMKRTNRNEKHGLAIAALVLGIVDLLHGPLLGGLLRFHRRW